MSIKDLLAAHAKTHKLTPGQQVNLLIFYLGLVELLPEVTFERFLERSLAVAGATDENRKFPKDALDFHCPNKGSAWKPEERIDMMLTYLALRQIMAEEHALQELMTFDTFLAMEAPLYKNATPASTQPPAQVQPTDNVAVAMYPHVAVSSANPTMQPPAELASAQAATPAPPATTKRTRVKPEVQRTIIVGERLGYRAPNGPVLSGVITMVGNGQVAGSRVYVFKSDAGEDITVTDPTLFTDVHDQPPAPALPPADALVQRIMLTAEQATAVEGYLALDAPIASKPIGTVFLSFTAIFNPTIKVVVEIVNGQPKPYVDAYIVAGDQPAQDVDPREASVYGTYTFKHAGNTYVLEVLRQ